MINTKVNKKGFTLIELVVTIAILAILTAIAIPVVNSVINTASKNSAVSNAQTIELAVKECQSYIATRNEEVYNGSTPNRLGMGNIPSAATAHSSINIQHVASAKAIDKAFETVTCFGNNYEPYWDTINDKCVFLSVTSNGVSLHSDIQTGTVNSGVATGTTIALAPGGTISTTAMIDNL